LFLFNWGSSRREKLINLCTYPNNYEGGLTFPFSSGKGEYKKILKIPSILLAQLNPILLLFNRGLKGNYYDN